MTTNTTPPPPSEGEGGGEPFRVGTHNTKATTIVRESVPRAFVGRASRGESDPELKTRPRRRVEERHVLPVEADAPERRPRVRRLRRGRDAAHGDGIRPELAEK